METWSEWSPLSKIVFVVVLVAVLGATALVAIAEDKPQQTQEEAP